MSYSLLSLAGDTKRNAMQGLRDAAQRENVRESQSDALKQAQKQQTMSAVGTGAAIGTSIAPGYGTVIGAAAGYIVGELF